MKNTPLCSFCNKVEGHRCLSLMNVPMSFTFGNSNFFEDNLILPTLTPQIAFLGLWSDNAITMNHYKPFFTNI